MTDRRHVITAAKLDAMTPAERTAAEQASIVRDPTTLPPAYLAKVQQRMADLAERDHRERLRAQAQELVKDPVDRAEMHAVFQDLEGLRP